MRLLLLAVALCASGAAGYYVGAAQTAAPHRPLLQEAVRGDNLSVVGGAHRPSGGLPGSIKDELEQDCAQAEVASAIAAARVHRESAGGPKANGIPLPYRSLNAGVAIAEELRIARCLRFLGGRP